MIKYQQPVVWSFIFPISESQISNMCGGGERQRKERRQSTCELADPNQFIAWPNLILLLDHDLGHSLTMSTKVYSILLLLHANKILQALLCLMAISSLFFAPCALNLKIPFSKIIEVKVNHMLPIYRSQKHLMLLRHCIWALELELRNTRLISKGQNI